MATRPALDEAEEGRVVGAANEELPQECSLFWRYGWLVGQRAYLLNEIESIRKESVERILAAIAEVQERADRRLKERDKELTAMIKYWQKRASDADDACREWPTSLPWQDWLN